MNYKQLNTQLGPLVFQSVSAGIYGGKMQKKEEDRMLSPGIDSLWWNNDLSKYAPYSKYWNTMLITGGHYCNKPNARELYNCDVDKTFVFADSGGFQLRTGKGVIQQVLYDNNGDMEIYAPNKKYGDCIKYSNESLNKILKWQENNSDVFINLDLPPAGEYKNKFDYALEISSKHFKYYADNRQVSDKILLNVLHGYDVNTINLWYNEVKKYPFDGWACAVPGFGIYMIMLKIATLLQNGEFTKESCKILHILGATSLYCMLIMCRIQHHLNKYSNNKIQITCDSSHASISGVYGRLIMGMDYKTMNYITFKVPQYTSGDNLYDFNKSIRLPFCDYDISIDKIVPKYTCAIDCVYNNIIVIYKSMMKLWELTQYPLDTLRNGRFIDNIYISVLESIDKMFDNPEHAINIIHQYKHVYDTIEANTVTNVVDDNLFNEYFTY